MDELELSKFITPKQFAIRCSDNLSDVLMSSMQITLANLQIRSMLAVLFGVLMLWMCPPGFSQDNRNTQAPDDPLVTMLPHSQTSGYWVSGHSNIIIQAHPSFDANYSGPNSLSDQAEHAVSNVSTLYTGFAL